MAEVMLGREDQGEAAGNRIGSGSEGQGGPGRRKWERETALKRRRGKSEEPLGASRTETKVCSGKERPSRPRECWSELGVRL